MATAQPHISSLCQECTSWWGSLSARWFELTPGSCLKWKRLFEHCPSRFDQKALCFPGRQNPVPFSFLLLTAQRSARTREVTNRVFLQTCKAGREKHHQLSTVPRGCRRCWRASPLAMRQQCIKTSLWGDLLFG